jgi:hypothetical protein
MNALAGFIMRGRSQAILSVSLLTVLSWLFSLASLLAAASVALPTLRRGGKEGALVVLGSLPVVALAGQLALGNALQAGGYSLAVWLPVMATSIVLRETASLSVAVLFALGLGLILVVGFYALVDDPATFWGDTLQKVIQPVIERRGGEVDAELMNQTMQMFSTYATGAVGAGSLMTVLISLLIARWWQANLYNPGGFRAEFTPLRLPWFISLAFLSIALVAGIVGGGMAVFSANLLMPVFMAFVLVGFAVLHALCSVLPSGKFWLAGIYVGLIFVAPMVLLIAVIGLTDPWLHWRSRFVPRSS